jgi:hypothetical protein
MPYIGNTPALDYISFAVQNFTVTDGTTVYTLDYSVSNENDIALYINSVAQRPGVSFAYSATGTTLTLTSATLATDTMYAVFIGRAVQTVVPPASSVTNTMLSPSVITGQTAETSIAGGDSVLIFDDSASALRKMTRTNFVSGLSNTPAFFAYLNLDQTGNAHQTDVKINVNTEVFDTDNCYDNSVNYRFTPNVAGKYLFQVAGVLDAGTNSNFVDFATLIFKNGNNVAQSQTNPSTNYGRKFTQTLSVVLEANGTTDYFELFSYGDTNNNGTWTAKGLSTTYVTYFGAYRLIGV